MNSAPACIILEQLGARGVELQGGRGGGEEEGELRKQPYQCWNGFAVGDVELLVWEKRNYSSFHPTLVEGYFLLIVLHTASKLHSRLAETFSQIPRKARERAHGQLPSDPQSSHHCKQNMYLSISPLRVNLRKTGVRVPALLQS